MKPTNRLADVIAEMEKIENASHQKEMSDDDREERAFFLLVRNAFTEFLETKPWVKSVGSDYWHGQDSSEERFGLRFTINVDHPREGMELEVKIERGSM